ncbi:hypothetical protein Tco_0681147 [Tanacetum coccineum]|uniref:Uncharacterized protein n=1 Tax=Tanacetum coccineum TaxID=301880 RepID=A0ABQ4XMH4_9ASTR
MDKHSVGELKELRIGLGLKINQVKARIEFLKSMKSSKVKKLDGRDLLKMPPNTHNLITIMASIDHNNINSFGSDHGVESFGSSNENVENGSSNSMASAMSKDDDNSLYDWREFNWKWCLPIRTATINDMLFCFISDNIQQVFDFLYTVL